ncbi:hypothetical protein MCAP1_001461 [Malassezia caprae]|uniref:Protein phosphatase inhibitor 2 (IPP-2) n=1 Tax=Malassezia caprae TaxID=1381934 RepID=A0AAF0IW60_9BASI|nr:hypothetical protein MCAP1_001461 [Malassezia caprae]
MTPRKEPVPSALAPKPRGILKNNARRPSENASQYVCVADRSLQWDEYNLQENQEDLDNTEPRMIIDEPKTPFVHGASEPPMEDDAFDLDDKAPPPTATVSNTMANARTKERAAELADTLRTTEAPVPRPHVVPIDLERINDEEMQEEARHASFDQKRHQHYGNEAAALKMAAALPEDDEMDM